MNVRDLYPFAPITRLHKINRHIYDVRRGRRHARLTEIWRWNDRRGHWRQFGWSAATPMPPKRTGHYRRSRELAAGVRPYGCEIINPCVGIGAASLPSAQAPFAVVLASSSKLFSSAAVSAATLEARDACAAGPPFCRSHRQRASRLRQRHMASGMTNDQRHERDRRTMQQ
jgi:hypothetical protein